MLVERYFVCKLIPYEVQPSLVDLLGWGLKMCHPDLLHCFHLGGRDLVASSVVYLVKQGFWPGRHQKKRLSFASRRLLEFAKEAPQMLRDPEGPYQAIDPHGFARVP